MKPRSLIYMFCKIFSSKKEQKEDLKPKKIISGYLIYYSNNNIIIFPIIFDEKLYNTYTVYIAHNRPRKHYTIKTIESSITSMRFSNTFRRLSLAMTNIDSLRLKDCKSPYDYIITTVTDYAFGGKSFKFYDILERTTGFKEEIIKILHRIKNP